MANKNLRQFSITSVCREDLEREESDISKVDDVTMGYLASKMENAYLEVNFWVDLPIIAEYLGIPRKD